MITEAITISALLGACAAAAWFAKTQFQPGIERSLAEIEEAEAEKETIVARKNRSKTH